MGYFANLYLIEARATVDEIEVSTSVFGAEIGPVAYFSWGVGHRPAGMNEYAGGSIFSDARLTLLPSYPRIERYSQNKGDDSNRYLIEADFTPLHHDDPVLFHFLLPERFVPRQDLMPVIQPRAPFINILGKRVSITYPVTGHAECRLWISRLKPDESLDNFEWTRMLHPEAEKRGRVEVEFNFGVFKIKFA